MNPRIANQHKSGATEALVPQVAPTCATTPDLNAHAFAAEIKADIARYEKTSREAAFIALRIGMRLIWIRDNEPYGTLSQFIAAHFGGKAERTLKRYIATAQTFLKDAGLLEPSSHRLTGKAWEKAAPIVAEQLELFTDPAAKLNGAVKKLVKWVGQRGLADIYRQMEERRNEGRKPPPGGKSEKNAFAGGASNRSDELSLEALIKHAEEEAGQVQSIYQATAWKNLDDEHLAAYETLLNKWAAEIAELLKARQADELARKKPSKKGDIER